MPKHRAPPRWSQGSRSSSTASACRCTSTACCRHARAARFVLAVRPAVAGGPGFRAVGKPAATTDVAQQSRQRQARSQPRTSQATGHKQCCARCMTRARFWITIPPPHAPTRCTVLRCRVLSLAARGVTATSTLISCWDVREGAGPGRASLRDVPGVQTHRPQMLHLTLIPLCAAASRVVFPPHKCASATTATTCHPCNPGSTTVGSALEWAPSAAVVACSTAAASVGGG